MVFSLGDSGPAGRLHTRDGAEIAFSTRPGEISRRGRVEGYVAPMPLFALWSAPRACSTAFFRSMLERGDLLALHEPLEGLIYFGGTEVQGRTFESPTSLLAWLLDEA